MRIRHFMTATILLGLLLTACVKRYPLGMSEESWNRLSTTRQVELLQFQAKKDAERAALRAQEAALEAKRQAREERRQRAYINAIYATARYGDIIQCIIRNPLVDFRPGWKRGVTTGFGLARSEVREVVFEEKDGNDEAVLWASFSDDGIKISLCLDEPTDYRRGKCDTLVATSVEYEKGVRKQIDLPDRLQGNIECVLALY